jgi:Outer membrane protein beta-barrel domain
MQDSTKLHNDSDEAFLNDSWEKMSSMLEAEMPVLQPGVSAQPKYQRSALLLLLLLIGSVSLFLLHDADRGAAKEIAQQEYLSHEPIATETIVALTEKSESKESTVEPSNNTVTNLVKPAVNNAVSITAVAETPHSDGNTRLAQNSLPAGYSSTDNIAETAPSEIISNTLTTNVQPLDPLYLAIKAATAIPMHIPSNHHTELEEKPLPGKSVQMLPPRNRKWTYGLMAGIQQEKINQGFGGFAITALVNRKLAKNFTLEAGLGYSMTQFNHLQLNNAPTTFNPSNGSGSNQGGIDEYLTAQPYNPSDASQEDPIQLGSASWLSIPILLTYQPGRRWRVNMGVEYAQLLHAREQKILGSTIAKGDNITDLMAENNIMALTGVTWMMQKNMALDIRYQYGFTDLSKVNPKYIDQTDTRAALQWSLLYFFNAK